MRAFARCRALTKLSENLAKSHKSDFLEMSFSVERIQHTSLIVSPHLSVRQYYFIL